MTHGVVGRGQGSVHRSLDVTQRDMPVALDMGCGVECPRHLDDDAYGKLTLGIGDDGAEITGHGASMSGR